MKPLLANNVRKNQVLLTAFIATFSLAISATGDLPAGNGSLSSQYIALSIQGDLRDAAGLFRAAEPLSETDLELKREFETRFLEQPHPEYVQAPGESLADDVAMAFRSYWRHGLMGSLEHSENYVQLGNHLDRIRIGYTSPSGPFLKDENGFPAEALNEAGIYYLDTTTPPYRDLFVWREQRSARYRVQLTDQSTPVTVNFMNDFVVQGWKEFASLGLATTTGWVENGELYCVAWAYDTATENFAISYLKHEARHLVDLQKFPDMQPVELEYRAKLTELSYAHSSLKRILDDFRVKAAENPESAHAMANWQVTRDMYREMEGGDIPDDWSGWGYPDVGLVNRVARDLLEENTRKNDH